MNDKNFEYAKSLIPATYVNQGRDAIKRRENLVKDLLTHRKIPEIGWLGNSGVGEREGRIASTLVLCDYLLPIRLQSVISILLMELGERAMWPLSK